MIFFVFSGISITQLAQKESIRNNLSFYCLPCSIYHDSSDKGEKFNLVNVAKQNTIFEEASEDLHKGKMMSFR